MATYSNNTTLSVNQAFAVSRTSNGVFFTVPANSYALFQISVQGTVAGGASFTLGGSIVFYVGAFGNTTSTSLNASGFVAGPGAVIQATFTGTYTAYVTGVVLSNSP